MNFDRRVEAVENNIIILLLYMFSLEKLKNMEHVGE